MTSNGTLDVTVEDGVAEWRSTDPERRNCVSTDFVEDAFEAIDELQERIDDGDVATLVLTHEGSVFCAGYDLDIINDPDRAEEREQLLERYHAVRSWLDNVDVPTIVGAKGPAVAAGAGHCLVGDIIAVGPEFRIWWPEVNVGLFPFTMGPQFISRFGRRRAAEIVFLGNEAKISPEEAREMGLVNRVVETDAVDEEVRSIGRTIAGYEAEYGYVLDAYEQFNRAKRTLRDRYAGVHEAEWRETQSRWFEADGDTRRGGRDDPRE